MMLDIMHTVTACKNIRMKFSLIRKDNDQPLLIFCNGDSTNTLSTFEKRKERGHLGDTKRPMRLYVIFEGGCYPGHDQCS